MIRTLRHLWPHFLVVGLSIAFPFWLMFHTIGYDPTTSSIMASSKYWSDFGSHLPLIRSFAFGQNWLPELPFYPGLPIKYHYAFYMAVGYLEQWGFRFDWALNLPSALGLSSLFLLIWSITVRLTRSRLAGLFALMGVLCNSSLSWLDFFSKHQLADLPKIIEFPSFGPWNGSLVAAFWNWNVYSNQRHLGLSFAIVFLLIYIVLFSRRQISLLVGFIVGSLLLINQAAFLVAAVSLLLLFPFAHRIRLRLIFSSLGLIPWVVLYCATIGRGQVPIIQPGFLIPPPLTWSSFLDYWWHNFGVAIITVPLGVLLAPRRLRLMFPIAVVLFVLANVFRLSPDIINNHKLINADFLIFSMFSACFLVRIIRLPHRLGYIMVIPVLVLLTAGGIVDFFPVINDRTYQLADYPHNPDVAYFRNATPPQSIVLNSTWFYHPASLAGRRIYNGYSYFTWSYGYNAGERENAAKDIYAAPTVEVACALARTDQISYIEVNPHPESFLTLSPFWYTLPSPDYKNPDTELAVYAVDHLCPAL